jgi:hypothetical protein
MVFVSKLPIFKVQIQMLTFIYEDLVMPWVYWFAKDYDPSEDRI